jgi:citrate lyase subunit beta / citryl-CoA lyase
MLAKAAMLPADEVFLDLEDSVAPQEKNDQTRQNVVDALLANNWVAKTRVVRINGVNTRWWLRDLVYVVERAAGNLDCVMLPKVEEPSQSTPSTTSSPSSKRSWASSGRSESRCRSSSREG